VKKFFVATICFALVLTACDQQGNVTTLTIRNESSHEVTHVRWNNASFANDATRNSIAPGTSVTVDVQAGSGFVRMQPLLNPFSIRIEQLVIVVEGERGEIVILDNTVVMQEGDNNRDTLASIAGVRFHTEIGGSGPGGGTVFFASGGQFREVSSFLGLQNRHNADGAARNHRGGHF